MFLKGCPSERVRLRLWFLLPLAVVLIAATLVIVSLIRLKASADSYQYAEEVSSHAEHIYRDYLDLSARMLGVAMEGLTNDRNLNEALTQRSYADLLRHSALLFFELNRKYGITHLYFSDPERVNILRAHQPERFGDTINRTTTLQAQETNDTRYGVELGVLGTLTLRLVRPWFGADGKLIGFAEVGMEIDHVMRAVEREAGVQVFVFVDKKKLDRANWESGMRMLGRPADWNQFSDMVMTLGEGQSLHPEILAHLQPALMAGQKQGVRVAAGNSAYWAMIEPLNDAGGEYVGKMLVLVNVAPLAGTIEARSLRALTHESAWVGAIACLILLAFFYWLVGVVGQQLDEDKQRLHELADRDGLTRLFCHRVFYLRLQDEFARSDRTGKPISLLLLDIDHFKRFNDQFGHQAGDRVLTAVSDVVAGTCREMDIPCRYGGEEITIILPETASGEAMIAAERLRSMVEALVFDFAGEKDARVTISIGVATSSPQLPAAAELTAAADAAMYRAKEQGRNRVVEAAPLAAG